MTEPRRQTGKRPTIEDVARAAGVSRSTVSRVLNGGRYVKPEAISKVNLAVGSLGYSVNQAARNLASGRTGSVAFVVSEHHEHLFDDPNFGVLIRAFSMELRKAGQHLLVTTAQDYGEEEFLGDYLTAGHVDGALFALPHEGEALLRRLAASHLPLVVQGQPLGFEEELSWVAIDEEAAAFEAVSYLIGQGRIRIGTITGPLNTSSGRRRLEGYRRAVAAAAQAGPAGAAVLPGLAGAAVPAGLPAPPGSARAAALPDLVVSGDWSPASARQGAAELLGRAAGMDGLFVASDLMAVAAMTVLREAGLRIPQDVAVVGFDDSAAAIQASPPLTTIHQSFEDSAAEAVRILNELIAAPHSGPQHLLMPTRLVRRESA